MAATDWVTLTRRTDDPKLGFLEDILKHRGIASRCNGCSAHAPILEVQEGDLSKAVKLLTYDLFDDGRQFDDIADDAPEFKGAAAADWLSDDSAFAMVDESADVAAAALSRGRA